MVEIRATHPFGFRNGEWAEIRGVVWRGKRPCFTVRFADGEEDDWPVYDPMDPYEFQPSREDEESLDPGAPWNLSDG